MCILFLWFSSGLVLAENSSLNATINDTINGDVPNILIEGRNSPLYTGCRGNYCAAGCDQVNCGRSCYGLSCAVYCKQNNCGQNCVGNGCGIKPTSTNALHIGAFCAAISSTLKCAAPYEPQFVLGEHKTCAERSNYLSVYMNSPYQYQAPYQCEWPNHPAVFQTADLHKRFYEEIHEVEQCVWSGQLQICQDTTDYKPALIGKMQGVHVERDGSNVNEYDSQAFYHECTSDSQCGLCQGVCTQNDHCFGELVCQKDTETVRGCSVSKSQSLQFVPFFVLDFTKAENSGRGYCALPNPNMRDCNGDGCAAGCNADQCGRACIGIGCAARCNGPNCGFSCIGKNCAYQSELANSDPSGYAGYSCIGENCARKCNGDLCGVGCVGKNCAKDCTGEHCGEQCAHFAGESCANSNSESIEMGKACSTYPVEDRCYTLNHPALWAMLESAPEWDQNLPQCTWNENNNCVENGNDGPPLICKIPYERCTDDEGSHYSYQECSQETKCNICQGICTNNDHCRDGLECMTLTDAGIPGCSLKTETDNIVQDKGYCYDPQSVSTTAATSTALSPSTASTSTTTAASTASSPSPSPLSTAAAGTSASSSTWVIVGASVGGIVSAFAVFHGVRWLLKRNRGYVPVKKTETLANFSM